MASHFRTWAAYQKAFRLALKLDQLSKDFPPNERFKLTDQISRSSRSVCASLGESFGKRRYPKHFISKITDAPSENFETQVWLDVALAKGYLKRPYYEELISNSEEVGRLLTYM